MNAEKAGQPSRVDMSREVPVEPLQRLRVEPHLARIDLLPHLCHRRPPHAFVKVPTGYPAYPTALTSALIVAHEHRFGPRLDQD